MRTFILWALAGVVVGAVLVASVAFIALAPRVDAARKGWDLKPVVVASRDVAEGQVLTFEDLTQRALPEQFVTPSVVRPEDAPRIVGRAPSMALKQNDVLLWAAFTDYSATDECFSAIASRVSAAKDEARDGALARFEARMGAPLTEPQPVPEPKPNAEGEVGVLVLKKEIPQGQVLEESMLQSVLRPRELVTASSVPADMLKAVAGARVLVALEANDALMWQMLDDAKRPRRVANCMLSVGAAMNEAHERARRDEAAAYVRGKEAR